jgi:hypothetical protein
MTLMIDVCHELNERSNLWETLFVSVDLYADDDLPNPIDQEDNHSHSISRSYSSRQSLSLSMSRSPSRSRSRSPSFELFGMPQQTSIPAEDDNDIQMFDDSVPEKPSKEVFNVQGGNSTSYQ